MKTWIEYKVDEKEYCIKQPNRREKDEADIFYAAKIGEFVKKGILTKAMLLKEYENNGGALTQEEAKRVQVLRRKLMDDQNDLTKLELKKRQTKTDKAKIEKIRHSVSDIISELQHFESFHEALFTHTADVIARNHLILWWVVTLLFHKKNKKSEWENFFDKESEEENLDFYEECLEDEHLEKAVNRAASLVAIWLSSNIDKREDFEEVLRVLESNEEPKEDEEPSDSDKSD